MTFHIKQQTCIHNFEAQKWKIAYKKVYIFIFEPLYLSKEMKFAKRSEEEDCNIEASKRKRIFPLISKKELFIIEPLYFPKERKFFKHK